MCRDEIREYQVCGHYSQTVTRLCARQDRTAEPCPDYRPYQEPRLEIIPSCCTNECCRRHEAPYLEEVTRQQAALANMYRNQDQFAHHVIRNKRDDFRRAREAAERVTRVHDRCREYRNSLYGDEEPYGPWLDGGMVTRQGGIPDRDRYNRPLMGWRSAWDAGL